MAFNLIFSIFGGFAIFVAATALTNSLIFERRRSLITEDRLPGKRQSVFDQLQSLLYQARAPIGVSEFLVVSGIIGAMISLGFYFATNALLVSILLYPVGSFLYYLHLTGRRDTAMMEYETAQPQVAYVLSGAFRSGGLDLDNAIEQVLSNGPEIVHEDWVQIRAAVSSAEPDFELINQVLVDRNSPGLWKLVEAILQFREEIERIPPAIDGLRERIIQEVVLARENASLLKSGRRQLMIMSALPIALLLFFTIASPEFRNFYSSFIGQIIMVLVFLMVLAIYIVGARFAARASLVRPYMVDLRQERKARSYQLPEKQEHDHAPTEMPSSERGIGAELMPEPRDQIEIEADAERPEVPGKDAHLIDPLEDFDDGLEVS